jgi:hypothetical protein
MPEVRRLGRVAASTGSEMARASNLKASIASLGMLWLGDRVTYAAKVRRTDGAALYV